MSVEELVSLASDGFTLSNLSFLAILVVSVLGGFIGSFCSSYTKAKGENFATKEDIEELCLQTQKLTYATELVKQQVANNSRVESKIWEMKLNIYTDILESLSTWRTVIASIISDLYNSNGSLKDTVKTEIVESRQHRMSEVFENIARIEAISELVLSNTQIAKIRAVRKDATKDTSTSDDVKQSFELAIENIKSLEAEIGGQAKLELFEKRS